MATLRGDIGTIKFLEKSGADPEAKNRSGDTPLEIAKLNQAEDIIAHFSQPRAQQKKVKRTPIEDSEFL